MQKMFLHFIFFYYNLPSPVIPLRFPLNVMDLEYSIEHKCVCRLNSTNIVRYIGDFHLWLVNLAGTRRIFSQKMDEKFDVTVYYFISFKPGRVKLCTRPFCVDDT